MTSRRGGPPGPGFRPGPTTPTRTRPESDPEPSGSNPFEVDEGAFEEDDAPETIQDRVDYDSLNWVDVVAGEVVSSLKAWGENNGYSAAMMGQIYQTHSPALFQDVSKYIQAQSRVGTLPTTSPEGLQATIDWAINWFGGKTGIPLRRSTGGGGGGRGSGARGPTAEDIRNQFDINELTNMVDEMNQAMVFEKHPNAKKLATQYVDAVVATKGEKKIDFATFVEGKITSTSRFKAIYRNKPEHLAWGEYMAPYIGAAKSVAAPDDADDIAIGAAQMGSSPVSFQARLQREDSVTGSAPFIQGLEGRLSELGSIFRGS